MTITRLSNSVKHLRHRSLHSGFPVNLALNAVAGGIDDNLTQNGVRLSGFIVSAYTPSSTITFSSGAFIHCGPTGDYRGLGVEERDAIQLDAAEIAAGSNLTLYGWSNDPIPSGDGGNAQYAVAVTGSPPVSHAVPLASTILGGESGPWHWTPTPAGSLLALRNDITAASERGSTRDFFHIAQNYQATRGKYEFMTFQDFGAVDGSFGAWVPQSQDEAKFVVEAREMTVSATQQTIRSKPFDTAIFSALTDRVLKGGRCVWLEQAVSGGVALPDPTFGCSIRVFTGTWDDDPLSATYQQWTSVSTYFLTFTGASEYDVDKNASGNRDLSDAPGIGVEVVVPANTKFQRMILLARAN